MCACCLTPKQAIWLELYLIGFIIEVRFDINMCSMLRSGFLYMKFLLCVSSTALSFMSWCQAGDSTMKPFKLKCLTGTRELTCFTEYCRYSNIDRKTKKEIRTSFKIKKQ